MENLWRIITSPNPFVRINERDDKGGAEEIIGGPLSHMNRDYP